MRYAHDTSLHDLKDAIQVEPVVNLNEASRERPAKVRLTIDNAVLSSILVAASLHNYENKFVPKLIPADPVSAKYARQENEEARDYRDLIRDQIDYIEGKKSVLLSPDYGRDKESEIISRRKFRPVEEQLDTDEIAAAADASPAEWLKAQNIPPINDTEIDGVCSALKADPDQTFTGAQVAALLSRLQKEAAENKSASERVAAARRALGG